MTDFEPLRRNGWLIGAHDLFLDQIAALSIDAIKAREGHAANAAAELLAAIADLAFREIPEDPSRPTYRQAGWEGTPWRHWRRANLPGGQRLYFRYRREGRAEGLILHAWIEETGGLSAATGWTRTQARFARMAEDGAPPADWAGLSQTGEDDGGASALAEVRNLLCR